MDGFSLDNVPVLVGPSWSYGCVKLPMPIWYTISVNMSQILGAYIDMAEIITFPTRGLDNTVPAQRTPITPGMLSTIRMPAEAQISPDGKRAAFVVWEYVGEEQKQRGHIWTVSTEVAEIGRAHV